LQFIKDKHQRLKLAFGQRINHSYQTRCQNLLKLKSLIVDNEDAILEALNKDLGKSQFEGVISETLFLINEIDFTLKRLKKWMKKRRVSTPVLQFPARSYIIPEPLGTVLIISPWNYPFQLLISPLIGALASGNTAMLKPSEVAPNVSSLVSELIPKYFSEDLIAVVEGGIPETQAILDLPFQHIFYTGNGTVGRIVMEKASKHLCPVTLELGGKSPCYVDEDNDLEVVARRIVWGKFFNAGQTCVAPDYILSTERVRDILIKNMEKALNQFFPKGVKASSDYGRIINEHHF
jgi:aldehyde dehydrogenase (NAD+)